MDLSDEEWLPVSGQSMHLMWLRGEREKPEVQRELARLDPSRAGSLFERPDLRSPEENRLRMEILYGFRGTILNEVPGSTTWHEVRYLRHGHLASLRVIYSLEWCSPTDRNELHKVAMRRSRRLLTDPGKWASPILWGHARQGPFTILEGNNRLVAYVTSRREDLTVPAIIGLSPSSCTWHPDDHPPPSPHDAQGL